jgi:FAD:protein FMN transferase
MMSGHANSRGPSRRDFLVLGAGIFTVSAVGLSRGRRRLVRRTIPVMGTIAEIAVVSRDEAGAQRALNAAVDELYGVHRLMSRFDAASDVGRINSAAHGEVVHVSTATADVLEEALHWAALPGSCFDPCLGRVTDLWQVGSRTQPPAAGDVRRLAARQLHRRVRLQRTADGALVTTADADVAIDLGGIAKGYAVDRAVDALRAWGITDALVNAGGDLHALGVSLEGDPWQVGIRSPSEPTRLAGTLPLRDRAIATSGDYEQYFEHDGRRYHHLLDPRTAEPMAGSAHSLTVAAPTCMAADAAATSIFGLEITSGRRVLARAGRHAEIVLLA